MSQTAPVERFHLIPDLKQKTRNGHYITLNSTGLRKEFDTIKLGQINFEVIKSIYQLNLQNVEHGTVNHIAIIITRVGSQLIDAVRVRHLSHDEIYDQVKMGIEQLHSNGFAHCDICVDNIFVDSVDDGGRVFIGDLEYCRSSTEPAPKDIRRSDIRASTAENLDYIQLEKLKDELSKKL
jgi:RIO-like serine/threonine protein kinase